MSFDQLLTSGLKNMNFALGYEKKTINMVGKTLSKNKIVLLCALFYPS